MEFDRVKAVAKTHAGSENRKKNKKGDGKWNVRFLELLVQELKEEKEGQEGQNFRQKKKLLRKTAGIQEDEEEYDCRIIEKGKEEVPLDWDSFEVTRDFSETVLTSELYEDMIDCVKAVGNWQADILYKIAAVIMQDYYADALSEQAVGELFCGCYQKCTEKNKKVPASKEHCREILEILYEYFVRVNARKSVAANEREGRTFVENSGLSWAGTTYYNSAYYYKCIKIQRLFQKKCREITDSYGLAEVCFEEIERRTQFGHVGGLTFHRVFVWIQQKDNHPSNQYGMRDLLCVPPKHFVYLYRNHCDSKEHVGICALKQRMKRICPEEKKQLWRSFILEDGRDYHNGMSYLLEGSLMDEEDETAYSEIMRFLQNFILFRMDGCVEYLLCWKA